MASEQEIKSKIISATGGIYGSWVIGITDDPEKKKTELGRVKNWASWEADSEATAQTVLSLFVEKRMKSTSAGPGKYVYIHLK